VVAEIARRLGIYTGADLNTSGDNLWFTLLLRRPSWYREQTARAGGEIPGVVEIFEQAMVGRLQPTVSQRRLISDAAADFASQHLDAVWIADRVSSLLRSRDSCPAGAASWGWKEPNTHVYLDHLHQHFGEELRYVHVIRHGLDMAWSTNQWQLRLWGELFGVKGEAGSAAAALEYWIEANSRAVSLGRRLLGERFFLVNFDELCADPDIQVPSLARFLGCGHGGDDVLKAINLPKRPPSAGRYRAAGLAPFTEVQLAQVEDLGFRIESEPSASRPQRRPDGQAPRDVGPPP
jgi:hypothetical protein